MQALADPKMKARLADFAVCRCSGLAADFGKLIADETEKWGKVVRVRQASSRSDAGIAGRHSITSRSANGWCPSVWAT